MAQQPRHHQQCAKHQRTQIQRQRQLAHGAEPLVGTENDKPTVLALREIAENRVTPELLAEIDRQEREKAEREALEWAAAEVVDDDLGKGGDDV